MELLVACALGMVWYCGWLTFRDTLEDLRREGVSGSLTCWWARGKKRLARLGRPQPVRFMEDAFAYLPPRVPVPVRVRQRAAAERWYRSHGE